jgi:hypothetical protein
MDVIFLTNVDEEEGQEKLISAYSEKVYVFKDDCNISEINRKYAKCFAEKRKELREEIYHVYLKDNTDNILKGSTVSSCLVIDTSQVRKLNKSY